MPIKRSQSAPQPIHATAAKPRPGTLKLPPTTLRHSKSYLVERQVNRSPLTTPWVEREDPFSLGGFFPASNRAAPEEEEQWKWLRKGDEDADAARNDTDNATFSDDDDASVIGQFQDELAEETIKSEDKFGLLSLDTMFTLTESDADDRLLSPYIEEDAVDNDSLYLSHCARRRANAGLQDSKFLESCKVGALFFPPTDGKNEVCDGNGYWRR